MNDGPLRECRNPRCGRYAGPDGYCSEHAVDQPRGPAGSNLTPANRKFRWMRSAFLMRHPVCADCRRQAATDLDHITPHRGNVRLFWDQQNWQGLCSSCHGRKTARETGWTAHAR